MIDTRPIAEVFWALATAVVVLFAAWITIDTLRCIVPLSSPLPWFDAWATLDLLQAWQKGDRSISDVLFSQSNEHRILLPRLVFFADDLLFGGRGRLSLVLIFLVQALHAAMFAAVLVRAPPRRPGRWAVAGTVVALMFCLRQAENFSSGFQVQFVGVFAGATLAFMLFGLAAARARSGRSDWLPLGLSFAAALGTAFTMANGLLVPFVLVVLALLERMGRRVVLLCTVWALLLAFVYLRDYVPVAHHGRPMDSLLRPLPWLFYVAAYLGCVIESDGSGPAALLGLFGIAATLAVAVRLAVRPSRPAGSALFGIMLFVGAGAAITAAGRLEFGVEQALASRYVTGCVTFWAAQLIYWWMDPPRGGAGLAVRAAASAVCALVLAAVWREQHRAKPPLAVQSFAQNEAEDLLLLGFEDPAVVRRVSWDVADVRRLLPLMREDRISIFATREAAALGRSIADAGRIADPDACAGTMNAARSDAALGPDGVRVMGTASDGIADRVVRRVMLADGRGIVVGLGSGAIPGADRGDWRGFAAAASGSTLTAYGLIGTGLCRLGSATVAQAIQPAPAP